MGLVVLVVRLLAGAAVMTVAPITPAERALLARPSWTIEELITLALVLRRVVAEQDAQGQTAPRQHVSAGAALPLEAKDVRRARRAARSVARVSGYFGGGR